ncbi:hypothetical protein [Sinorhizobium meliloti]|uniref:hypothetical protein n=1 Tax=Rhizobium meliloti TaxID=382 RepID=UPI000FD8AD90|nr:hypothetical protein [Sinorhizobium meliloti]RVG15439.1 hypothetical protein CN231_16500 [Sinorhizobium meliloti]
MLSDIRLRGAHVYIVVVSITLALGDATQAQSVSEQASRVQQDQYSCLATTSVDAWEFAKAKVSSEVEANAEAQQNPVESSGVADVLSYSNSNERHDILCKKSDASEAKPFPKKTVAITADGGAYIDKVEVFQIASDQAKFGDLYDKKQFLPTQYDVVLNCPIKTDERYDADGNFAYTAFISVSRVTFSPSSSAISDWVKSCGIGK